LSQSRSRPQTTARPTVAGAPVSEGIAAAAAELDREGRSVARQQARHYGMPSSAGARLTGNYTIRTSATPNASRSLVVMLPASFWLSACLSLAKLADNRRQS